MIVHGILLAAGRSARMGRPKQLLLWQGRPLVRHVAEVALASRLAELVVVLGAYAEEVAGALEDLNGAVRRVRCVEYARGQATSLRCGLEALPSGVSAVVVLLVDQPRVTPELINRLIAAFEAAPEAVAVAPRYRGQRGTPTLLAERLFADVRALEGDLGARPVLARYADAVRWLDLDDPAVVEDMDTPEDYEHLVREAQ
ncbi:MAG: nucleotidyltransferase family protein [Oscillochloridaceae bacterium]|nr:nucleotidyltransferase family protein [Chloroflexaceae bacterium]MDW8389436.1 nucleotidyltransferase family protein [Oscillochloridaceae bacterium]